MTSIRESFKKYFLNDVAKIYYLFVMWRNVCVCLSYSCCPVDVPAVAGVNSGHCRNINREAYTHMPPHHEQVIDFSKFI